MFQPSFLLLGEYQQRGVGRCHSGVAPKFVSAVSSVKLSQVSVEAELHGCCGDCMALREQLVVQHFPRVSEKKGVPSKTMSPSAKQANQRWMMGTVEEPSSNVPLMLSTTVRGRFF